MKSIKKSIKFAGRELILESGNLAEQADAAILARYGETIVLATVVSANPREDLDYFPLSVEYLERLYAGGRIKGSRWVKREGRSSDDAVLKGRLIDRSIRPLFPGTYKNDVQVVVTVLSLDNENDPDILSILAVSAALRISSIPWHGPVGAVRVGYIDKPEIEKTADKIILNPTTQEVDLSDLDLVVSGIKDRVVMLEGAGNQVAEDVFMEAVIQAQKEINRLIEFIDEFAREINSKKEPIPFDKLESLTIQIEKEFIDDIAKLVSNANKINKKEAKIDNDNLLEQINLRFGNEYSRKDLSKTIEKLRKKIVRRNVLEKNLRIDGRGLEELREIETLVDIFPRTHGSAIFRRGSTQALTVTTLASPALEQWLESPLGEETKRYMHHYYMPPYSVGETGRFGMPNRREIGHGALAEKALIPVLPSQEEFSYTIRVVSEILSSNGSTSMASVCGSSLSLMDAGVPIKAPVAGISIGLITGEKDKYVLLSDIIGAEDFAGDMDFKIAGTREGITAVQLDVKIHGLTEEIIRETVKRSRKNRLFILDKMAETLTAPRDHLSKYAPKVERFKIAQEKIGGVIGAGGKIIRKIIADYNVNVDVEDDGTVVVSGLEKINVENASELIKGMTKELKAGDLFTGEVKRIVPFGAFVEIFPGREGLVHISRMCKDYVEDPREIVSEGDKVEVKINEIDDQGRVNLTMNLDDSQSPPPRKRNFRSR